jgi:hypothetical protein
MPHALGDIAEDAVPHRSSVQKPGVVHAPAATIVMTYDNP